MDMTLEEQGAYRNLLDEAHLRGGPIPNDERILAKACGDATVWAGVRTVVLARFTLSPEGWRNDTMDEVYKRTMQLHADRSRAGRAGNRKRWSKPIAKPIANEIAKPIANASSPSPSPSPSPSLDPAAGEQILGGSASLKAGVNGHPLKELIEPSHRIHAKVLAAKIVSDTRVRRRAARIR